MIIFKTTKHLKSRYRPCENCPIYIKSRNIVKKKSGKNRENYQQNWEKSELSN